MISSRASFASLSMLSALGAVLIACTVQDNSSSPDSCPTPDGGPAEVTQDGGTPDGATGEDLGECTPYTPATIAGTKTGSFAANDDVVTIPLPATDVGGGLLKITMTAERALETSIWLLEGEKKDEGRWEAGVMDGETGSFHVRLQGNTTYELRVVPLNFRDDEPNGYTVEYAYEPLVDCYEANDTRETAKRIPLDTPIKAFLHPGIGPNSSRIVSFTADDWYWFELPEERSVTLRGNLPGDNTAYFSVRDSEDATVYCDDRNFGMSTDSASTAQDVATCTGTLPAGKYWVKAAIDNSEYPGTGTGEPVPTSWNNPYTLTIETAKK